jgi:hypothetical protein
VKKIQEIVKGAKSVFEHNGRYVHPCEYGTTQVFEGDRLEFIHPDFGG